MDREKGFWRGTIFGALIGAVAGLLLAPKSGKETQDEIKQAARGMRDDLDRRANEIWSDLTGRIDELKDAAQDLKGEAKAESQDLIARAELLKTDLRASAAKLAKSSAKARGELVKDVRVLVDEGAGIMAELERVTKKLATSAKQKTKKTEK